LADLEEAIERNKGLNEIYRLRDVNDIATNVVAGITKALNAMALMEAIRARPGGNIYLSAETLRLMEKRDSARGISYKHLRNRVSSLVKRDKLRCSLATLHKGTVEPCIGGARQEQAVTAGISEDGGWLKHLRQRGSGDDHE
jgi:hypothetical protein